MLPPISHQNLLLHQAAAITWERTQANGGATFRLERDGRITELRPTSGFAVGLSGGWVGAPSYETLRGALYDLETAGRLPGTFGTWIEAGRLYLDPVSIVDDRDTAIALGIAHEQIALYDFERAQDLRLRCWACSTPLYSVIRSHGHTDDGEDVTVPPREDARP